MFTCVLSACNHASLMDEGWDYFDCMRVDNCIKPRIKHYTCMVDILGRAGIQIEAQDLIDKIPLHPNVGVWGALLGACKIHGNLELGKHVTECLFDLQPKNIGYYVLYRIYVTTGMWDDVTKVRSLIDS